jgi:hypothetical protein
MNNKPLLVSLLLLLVLCLYIGFFRGCKDDPFQITCKLRPAHRGTKVDRGMTPMYDVSFGFNKPYRLDSIKVVVAEDLATNKYPVALWHLVAEASPRPVKAVIYGRPVAGMKSAVEGVEPEVLLPDTEYVVLVEAGNIRGRTNFVARQRPVPQ